MSIILFISITFLARERTSTYAVRRNRFASARARRRAKNRGRRILSITAGIKVIRVQATRDRRPDGKTGTTTARRAR